MNSIQLKELEAIPYANPEVLGDRTFLLMPLWDGNEWVQWIDGQNGTLIKMKPIDVVRSHYIAKKAASEDDLFIPFIDLMWQRANWPEVTKLILALSDDFHNLSTSMAKIKYFYKNKDRIPNGTVSYYVQTELEYLFIVSRTIFDLLQETIATLWNGRVRLLDNEAEKLKKRHSLPPTFSKIVLNNKIDIKSQQEIIDKYALPDLLAEEYIKHASFFISLRKMRDRIVHGGKNSTTVFVTDKGFCVAPNDNAFNDFKIWRKEDYYNENVASILPLFSHVIFSTIGACSEIMNAFATQVSFPEEIAPGYNVFIRDHTSNALLDLLKVHKGEMRWW